MSDQPAGPIRQDDEARTAEEDIVLGVQADRILCSAHERWTPREHARRIIDALDQHRTASGLVWLVHSCEGNTFEQRLPRSDAEVRLAQLEADETVTDARIEADAAGPRDLAGSR